MAITYVGGQTASILGSTTADETVTFSLTGGLASAPAEDDLVVICVAASRFGGVGVTSLVTTGYTSTTKLVAADAQDSASQVHYKFMGGTPDTEVVITRSGATDSGQAYTIHVFRGVDLTTPLDVATTTAIGIDTGRPDPAAITPTTAGAWIYIGTADAAATGSTFTYGDFTAVLSTVCDESANDAVVGSGYYDGWTSGAYDPAASTTGSTSVNSSWTATTMAFRPAAAGTTDADFNLDATASVTWGGASTAATNLNAAALASVTWTGVSTATSNLNAAALASVTWGGAEVVGGTVESGDWSAAATASVTWGGAAIASNAWSSTASSAASGGAAGASIDAQDWRVVARFGFPSSSSRWAGASVAGGDYTDAAVSNLTWDGVEVAATTVSGSGSLTAAASFTAASATIAAASFEAVAAASLTVTGRDSTPPATANLDGWKPKHRQEEIEDEDLMFLMTAVHTYMEQNNVHY